MHRGTHLLGWCVKLPCGDAFRPKSGSNVVYSAMQNSLEVERRLRL